VRVAVLGTFDDVCGFGLAGVEGVAIADARALESALADMQAQGDVAVALISHQLAARARQVVDRFARGGNPPLLLVLPPPEGESEARR
jgi:vacuolar-type H+-ATPase subunit F/Vma7